MLITHNSLWMVLSDPESDDNSDTDDSSENYFVSD